MIFFNEKKLSKICFWRILPFEKCSMRDLICWQKFSRMLQYGSKYNFIPIKQAFFWISPKTDWYFAKNGFWKKKFVHSYVNCACTNIETAKNVKTFLSKIFFCKNKNMKKICLSLGKIRCTWPILNTHFELTANNRIWTWIVAQLTDLAVFQNPFCLLAEFEQYIIASPVIPVSLQVAIGGVPVSGTMPNG